ncbi:MAG: E3 ubiquitin protein ligase [Candidatus Heimdallarchaeota archaeon]|nr:E3 ubiquitin protein ligase [Candidatus Heimdallarchaeota archaeon]
MVKLAFEREDVYEINFSDLDLPEVNISKRMRAQILTQLYLTREIHLLKFSTDYKIPVEAIKDYIQLIVQALVVTGSYRRNIFSLATIYKYPKINSSRVTSLRKMILGFLSQSEKVNLSNLSEIVGLSKKELIDHLYFLTSRGLLIGSIKQENILVQWIWVPEEKFKLTKDDTFIVGIAMMLRKADMATISKITEFPKEEIIEKISKLFLFKKLEAKLEYKKKKLGTGSLHINVTKYIIEPKIIPLSTLQGIEKEVTGYLILTKKASPQEIRKFIGKEKNEILRSLATLTARGTFQFVFSGTNDIVPVTIPEFNPTRTIEEMATLSFFSYEALFGLLSTQKKISLRRLSVLINRTDGEALEGVINLLLEGFIKCSLSGNTLIIEGIKRYSRTQEGTLERWERIILGMIVSKASITTKDISLALGIDKHHAKERLYGFYGKGLIKGSIDGNKLVPEEIPLFPPLIQLDDLPIHYQEIYGYIISNSKTSLKSIQKIWEKSAVAVTNIIFELVGSGLLNIDIRGSAVYVESFQKILPSRELKDLGEVYIRVVNEIEKSRRRKIRLITIAEILNLPEIDIFKMTCQLIAHGYYQGSLTQSTFERLMRIKLPSKKTHCLKCGHVIESANEPCKNCKELPTKCSICQGLIKHSENVMECPSCTNVAHKEHMEQWLKIKEECPICKTRITKRTLKTYST